MTITATDVCVASVRSVHCSAHNCTFIASCASLVTLPSTPHHHAGKYVLLYDGQGKIILDGDATVNWQAPGRIGLTLAPANGFAVRILETDTSNPVRNISVVPAAKELTFATDIYQPDFLKLLNGGCTLLACAESAGGRGILDHYSSVPACRTGVCSMCSETSGTSEQAAHLLPSSQTAMLLCTSVCQTVNSVGCMTPLPDFVPGCARVCVCVFRSQGPAVQQLAEGVGRREKPAGGASQLG